MVGPDEGAIFALLHSLLEAADKSVAVGEGLHASAVGQVVVPLAFVGDCRGGQLAVTGYAIGDDVTHVQRAVLEKEVVVVAGARALRKGPHQQ